MIIYIFPPYRMAKFTQTKRDQLEVLLRSPTQYTQQQIAAIICCNQSTISRELKRSRKGKKRRYSATMAQKRANERFVSGLKKRTHWYDDAHVLRYVLHKLRDGRSPLSIAGRMKRESPWHNQHSVSHQSIYTYIKAVQHNGGCMHKYLRYQGKKYKFRGLQTNGRGMIPHRIGIEDRPLIVEKRKRCGDWESDLVVSSKRGHGAIATFAERKTKYLMAELVTEQSADEMVRATKVVFTSVPARLRKTMTHDNGKEIAKHAQITKDLCMPVYCANPYCSWERPLNENLNRELRRYFPKGTDFSTVTAKELVFAVEKINTMPRQSLRFCTAQEVFSAYVNDYAFQT
jgi:transposase, IS30 family